MQYQYTPEFAAECDANDTLKNFRDEFFIPQHDGKDVAYFCGNSLGLQPKKLSQYIQAELDVWAKHGVEGHFTEEGTAGNWMAYHERFAAPVAKIVGALPSEVVVMNQLTVNLHLLLTSFYRPTEKRYKILCEKKPFPSDVYAFESQVKLHGFEPADAIIEIDYDSEYYTSTDSIIALIEKHANELAVVCIGGVNYYTGQYFNLETITDAAHNAGAIAGFDLAHAAGNVELKLHDWDVDFACWCSYKYLNSGPGGVAGAYVHEKHHKSNLPRMAGWWGHNKEERFQMNHGFKAIESAEGWQLSNAPVLSMAAHKASVDIFDRAGMESLVEKAKQLSAFTFFCLNQINKGQFQIITPQNPDERGCQVSLLFSEKGRETFDKLTSLGIIADWRNPNVIRIAPVPLYNSFTDVYRFVNTIESMF